jgi:hypothetical protein
MVTETETTFLGIRARLARKADNLTDIFEPGI